MNDQKEAVCAFCTSSEHAHERIGQVGNTHSAAFSRDHFDLIHCRACDVVYLDPLPTNADLHQLYQCSEQFSDALYTDQSRIDAVLEYYGTCLDNLSLLPDADSKSLEVGAGFAWVSRAIKMRNPDLHTIAQDVTDECADQCNWVNDYFVGEVHELPMTRQFGLISLTHVIEHLIDPAIMLRQLSDRLIQGGKMLVTAPFRPENWQAGDGLDAWKSYSYLHVPAHISYLSSTWFEQIGAMSKLSLIHWDASHENGQAFEAVLQRMDTGVT